MRPSYSRARNARVLLIAALLACATALAATRAAAYTPKTGDSFTYSETITVNNGGGAYQGYSDQTVVSGGEQVVGVSGGIVSQKYDYSFQYSNSEGSSSSSTSQGPFAWSADNFTYVNGTDNQAGYTAPIYVWFAMNASLPVGASFYALNTQFTVLSRDYSFQLPTRNEYIQTIQAEGTGQYQRDDSYGVFTAKYTWYEYFDPSTGYIVGYNYIEQDTGEYQGQSGSFAYTDNLYVTSTSYPLAVTSGPPTTSTTSTGSGVPVVDYAALGIVVLVVIIIIVVVVLLLMRRRRLRNRLPEHSPPSASPPPPPPPPPGSSTAQPSTWASGIDLGSKPPEQVVIREVAKTYCKYCGALIPTTVATCPQCGAPRQ